MLPEPLRDLPLAAWLESWDSAAVLGGSNELGELIVEIAPAQIRAACQRLKAREKHVRLSAITVIDRFPAEPRFEVVYLLHFLTSNARLRLKCNLPADQPELESVTSVWIGAGWYEREAYDLFGVRFTGHPDLKRILMPDDWDGHPLRKDFPVHGHKYSYQNE